MNPTVPHLARRRLLQIAGFLVAFAFFEVIERRIGSRGLPARIDDLMPDLFTPVTGVLQSNPRLADALPVATIGPVDVAGFGLVFCSIFGRSVRPLVGLPVLCGMRQSIEVPYELPAYRAR